MLALFCMLLRIGLLTSLETWEEMDPLVVTVEIGISVFKVSYKKQHSVKLCEFTFEQKSESKSSAHKFTSIKDKILLYKRD